MNEYFRSLVTALFFVCGAIGHALAQAMPGSIAAPLGVILGTIWAQRSDQVMKHFKSDIDRILEPNEQMQLQGSVAVAGALAVTSLLGTVCGGGIGAMIGIALLIIVVMRFFK